MKSLPNPILFIGVALLFAIAAWGGIALTSVFGRIATIWLSNGLLVAALLIHGHTSERWYGLLGLGFVTNLALNLVLGDPPLLALGIAVANSLEIGIAAYALRGVLTHSTHLLQLRTLLRFFAFGMVVAPAAASLVAAASIHAVRGTPVLEVLRLWIPADALGMGLMVPLLLALRSGELTERVQQSWVRVAVPLVTLVVVSVVVFAQSRYPLLFLLLPPLLFLVFRLGFTGAALGISLIATIAIAATLSGSGPFMLVANATIAERVFTMQLLLLSLIVTTYPVCAMLDTQARLMRDSAQHLAALSSSQATVTALNEQMKLAARAAKVGFYTWNFETNEIEWDTPIYEMFRLDPASGPPTYEAWRARVHPADLSKAERTLNAVIESGTMLEMEFRMVWPDGTLRDVRCAGTVLRDPQNKPLKLIGLNIDITDLRRLDRMKSEFVSVVSHELRTPLTSIRGALGLLASGKVPEAKIRELVVLANRNAEQLAILIDDILDMERIESGKLRFDMRTQRLTELLEEAAAANAAYAERFHVELRVNDRTPDLRVSVDSSRMLQVLANLISNAAKFSPHGAAVDISTDRRQDGVRISVRDYGAGIAKEFRDKIFGKFCQGDSSDSRAKSGSGLGLAISKALVEGMSGAISFETECGQGTTFFIDLPVIDDAAVVSGLAALR